MSAIDSISATPTGSSAIGAAHGDFALQDRTSGPNAGVGTLSFDDFIDMVNPLQHIPIVSSIYRAVTNETISPLSRIAGDTLYGGALGLASAGLAAIGAIGDEVFSASNDGKGAAQTVMAALFGSDDDRGDVQLAAKDETPTADTPDTQTQNIQFAALQTPARQSSILDMTALPVATVAATAAATTATTTPATADSNLITLASANATAIEAGKGLAIDRSKAAYGGVMDPGMMQNALQNQSLALAMASSQGNMQASHALRNSRFATNTASSATAPTGQSASLPLPGDTPSLNPTAAAIGGTSAQASTAQTVAAAQTKSLAQGLPASVMQALPQSMRGAASASSQQSLRPDLQSIKGLDQYRSTASRVPSMGTSVDVSN